MQRPSSPQSWGTDKSNTKKQGMKKKFLVLAAAASAIGVHSANAGSQLWDPGMTGLGSGGTGAWNTSSLFWDTGSTPSVWANTTVNSDAIFQGSTGGIVSVEPTNGINLETAKFNISGYVLQGGPITLAGTTPGFGTATAITTVTTISAPLLGTAGAKYLGAGAGLTTMNVSGSSSYTGLTQILQATFNYSSLALSGFNSSFGQLGIVDIGGLSSAVTVNNIGVGGTTDRLWQNVGTSTSTTIGNFGTAAIGFMNTSTAVASTVGTRGFIFAGNTSSSIINTFAEGINDTGTGLNITKVTVSGGTWNLSGANNYSAGTLISGGILIAGSAETAGVSGPLGETGVVNFSGGTLEYSSLNAYDYSARIAAGTSTKAVSINTNGQNVSFATGLTSLATGGLTKLGSGTLTLLASDAYTGNTNISGGTLAIGVAGALPSTSIVNFGNTTSTATLDITGLTQTIAGLTTGTQLNSSSNTVTILGNSSSSLMITAATAIQISPFNSSGNVTVDMSSLGSFSYINTAGAFNVSLGVAAASTSGSALLKLAGTTDQITANVLNLGNVGSSSGGIGQASTIILGTNSTLDVNTLNIGNSGSRANAFLNAGSGTLTIAGASGGASLATLNLGRNDSAAITDVETSIFDTSAGTLNAQFGNVVIGQTVPTGNQTTSRGVTINAGLKTGAGNLSASTLTIGVLNNATGNTGAFSYLWTVNGSFNMTSGTATIPNIALGENLYTGNFNTTTATVVNATLTLNTGATLNSSNISSPGLVVPVTSGLLTINPVINWNDGSIVNIAGTNLSISGATINLAGATANHALNISSGQVANISSTINGSAGVLSLIGAGTVNLLSPNNYAGATNISAGVLMPGAANTLSPNSGINILAGGTLNTSSYVNTIASLTQATTGVLDLGIGNLLNVTGVANVTGVLNLTGTAGTLPVSLMNYSSGSNISFTSETGIPTGDSLYATATSLELAVTGSISSGPGTLNYTNASGNGLWDTSSLNFNTAAGTTVAYSDTSNGALSAGDIVAFTDNNNGNYNVSIPATVHPTSTTVNNSGGSYIFNGSAGIAGPGSLLKMGTGTLSLYVSDAYTGGTNISAGTLALYNAHALPSFGNVSIGSTAKIVAHTVGNAYALQISGLSITPGGTIDLVNNAATIRGSSIGAVYPLVKSGFNSASGTWTGTGITSSLAAGSSLNALGVIINDTGANTGPATNVPIYNTSSGAGTAAGDILVKYTYYGDANLDGKVDGSDYSLIDYGYTHGSLTGWFNGDFNYDGVVDGSDYTLIDNAFNSQGTQINDVVATPTAQIAGSSAVPEPASLSLLALGAVGLLGRRRR